MTNHEIERWVHLRDYPMYEVSSFGRVRNIATGRVLKNNKNNFDNYTVALRHQGATFVKSVARLVLMEFAGDPPTNSENPTPMHLDHDRSNCAASNLVWRPRWFSIQYMREWKAGPQTDANVKVIDLRTAQVYDNAWTAAHQLGTLERFIVANADLNRNDPDHYSNWSWYHE